MAAELLLKDMENALADTETLARATGTEAFDVYILGGAGCVLAQYLERATRDFDIIDLGYSASLGRVMKPLEPFDLIDPSLAALAPDYKARATRLSQFEFLSVYVLSREDIIISKAARLNERDFHDICALLPRADTALIFKLAGEVLAGDLLPKAKHEFYKNFSRVMESENVPDCMQQLEELRKRF